jgi:hypothetical protein
MRLLNGRHFLTYIDWLIITIILTIVNKLQINHDSETSSKNIIWNTEDEVITWKIVISNIKVEYKLETISGPDFDTNSQNIKKFRFFSILVPDAKEKQRVFFGINQYFLSRVLISNQNPIFFLSIWY